MSCNVPIRLIIVFRLLFACAQALSNVDGRETVVMVAPSLWDTNYELIFDDLVKWQIEFANMLLGRDNVIIIADKHTLPYYTGRTDRIKTKLSADVLLEADVYDVHIRDFAPMGIREFTKFRYSDPTMVSTAADQIYQSLDRLMDKLKIKFDRDESQLHLTGCDIVDNGINKAIINEHVIAANEVSLPDWAVKVKLLSVFRQVAYTPVPVHPNATENATRRLDDYMAFIDEDTLLVGDMLEEQLDYLKEQMHRRLAQEVHVVQLPDNHDHDDQTGSCGTYAGLVATKNFIYLPVYGNDPANWEHGHSSMTDKMVMQIVQVNTPKTVIPVTLPRSLCANGLSVRALSWTLDGQRGQLFVDAARWASKLRVV